MDDRTTITELGNADVPERFYDRYDLSKLAIHEAWKITPYDEGIVRRLRVWANQWSKKYTRGKARFTVRKYKPMGDTELSIFIKRLPDEE